MVTVLDCYAAFFHARKTASQMLWMPSQSVSRDGRGTAAGGTDEHARWTCRLTCDSGVGDTGLEPMTSAV